MSLSIFAILFSGTALPQYITNRIQENERKYAGTNKVSINELHLQYGASAIHIFSKEIQPSSHTAWTIPMMHMKRILRWSPFSSRRKHCLNSKGKIGLLLHGF